MSEADLRDVEAEIKRLEPRVVETLYPEWGKDIVIDQHKDFTWMRESGKPSISHYRINGIANGKPYSFVAIAYGKTPDMCPGTMPPLVKDYYSHIFLERAGISVPKTAFFQENPTLLFTEFIKGKTHRQLIEEELKKEKPEMPRFLESVVLGTDAFQTKATEARRSNLQISDDIFASRAVVAQALNYFEILFGDKERAKRFVMDIYMPLFNEALSGDVVNHGDLGPDNVIRQENGVDKFLDPELKLRGRMADFGNYLSYLGNYEHLWDALSDFSASLKGEDPELTRFASYANICHHSARIVAKRQRDKADGINRNRGAQYDEAAAQRKGMQHIFEALKTMPDKFGLDRKKKALADRAADEFSEVAESDISGGSCDPSLGVGNAVADPQNL